VPVAENDAVPVAEFLTVKYITPPEKFAFVRAVVIAVELSAAEWKLTVDVVEDRVIVSPEPSEAAAPASSVNASLYKEPPVEPVIVVPDTDVIVAFVGVVPVETVREVTERFAAMLAVESAWISAAVSYAAAEVPTKNIIVYEPAASGVKLSVNDCVAVESPVALTYAVEVVQLCTPGCAAGRLSPAELCSTPLTEVLPYEPLPDAALAQPKPVKVDAEEEIAGVPGTAPFEVANDVAGALVTRAPTIIESPIA